MRIHKTLIAATFTLLLITLSCNDKQPASGKTPVAENTDGAEKLLGLTMNYDKSEISLIVITKGCTAKSDFSFSVRENTLTIHRQKADDCKAMPEAVEFTYSLKEAGLDVNKAYKIGNPFIANPNLASIP